MREEMTEDMTEEMREKMRQQMRKEMTKGHKRGRQTQILVSRGRRRWGHKRMAHALLYARKPACTAGRNCNLGSHGV